MNEDPYQYFRIEGRELLAALGEGVLQLERGGGSADLGPRLLRLAHTLKGAARVVKQAAIAEHAHAIEEALGPLRLAAGTLEREGTDELVRRLDAIGAALAVLDSPDVAAAVEGAAASDPAHRARDEVRTLRANLDEVDALMDVIGEAHVQLQAIRRATAPMPEVIRLADPQLRNLLGGMARSIDAGVDQLERELRQIRGTAERLRLVPVASMFGPLERAARDVAREQHKEVSFHAASTDLRLDGHAAAVLQPALAQIVRNAVAHGIEDAAERRRLSKPAVGRVELEVTRRGARVAFVCRDDGGGVDVEAIRRVVVRRRAEEGSRDAAAPTDDEVLRVLLRGGVSTSAAVSEIAGRGIGLDIVREVAERLGGEVTLHTTRGQGTRLELVVPMARASIDALMIDAGGTVVAIPIEAVIETRRVAADDLLQGMDGDNLVHQGLAIPFLPLQRLLGRPLARTAARRAWSVVVVRAGGGTAALGIERLAGMENIVVRSLPPSAPASSLVAGASIDVEGTPQLVLDPESVVALVAAARREPAPDAEVARLPILVIDDSLTTRMLEKSILESAGYEVDLATSGEEGLQKALARRYGLFLVDVEMPGMDGFTFVERTRADARLLATPAVLVTSRSSTDDRRRGATAGAAAYVVKGDFEQGVLLRHIERLLA